MTLISHKFFQKLKEEETFTIHFIIFIYEAIIQNLLEIPREKGIKRERSTKILHECRLKKILSKILVNKPSNTQKG